MAYFVHIVCSFLMHILSTFVPIFCIFCLHSSAYLCIYSAYFAVWNLYNGMFYSCIFQAYFLHISLYSCIFTAYLLYFVHIFASCWLFQLILCNTYPSSAGPFLFHSCSTSQQKLQINSSLPVNTLTARVRQTSCQPGPKVRPSQLEGLQLLAHSLLACRLPFPPSAPIGEPNQPGRHPAGTMQCLSLQLLQQPLQQGFYIVFCCLATAARQLEASPGKSDFSVELFLE